MAKKFSDLKAKLPEEARVRIESRVRVAIAAEVSNHVQKMHDLSQKGILEEHSLQAPKS
jgi:hypothetical protein